MRITINNILIWYVNHDFFQSLLVKFSTKYKDDLVFPLTVKKKKKTRYLNTKTISATLRTKKGGRTKSFQLNSRHIILTFPRVEQNIFTFSQIIYKYS